MTNFFKKFYSIIKKNLTLQNFLFLFFCLKRNKIKSTSTNKIVLVEFNQFPACLISYFYFMNILFKFEDVKFYLLDINFKKKINDFFFYLFFYFIGIKNEIKFTKIKKKNHYYDFFNLKNKKDIINFRKYGINIGIDIYEGFLRTYNKPTINLNDPNFKNFFFEYLEYFEDMFIFIKKNKKNIKGLIIFQTLYKINMLCKLAYKYQIPVYLPDIEKFHRNEKTYDETLKFNFYKKESLKERDIRKKINIVKKVFLNREKGIQSNELFYSKALLNRNINKYKKIFDINKKIRVLICSHCFYDNPHPYEKSSFCDYYEWLTYLCILSKKTNYSWRIKVHNDCLPGTVETIYEIINKTKCQIKVLPKDITHKEIINNKVTHVLTCHGTVGFEYPYFKIPVINFNYNPRISFKFNIHAKNNIQIYENILMNLKNISNKKINLNELFISYYMHYYRNNSNLFIDDFYKIYAKNNKDGKDYFFEEFIKTWSETKERNINLAIEMFLKNKIKYYCWKK